MKYILPLFILIGCSQANETVNTVVDLEKTCGYLLDYAKGVRAAVVAKDYSSAVELVNKAYQEASSQEGQPCLGSAVFLVDEAHKYIQQELQKNGED